MNMFAKVLLSNQKPITTMRISNCYAKYACILLLLLLFGTSRTWAQVLDAYTFTQTAGTYTPLTGGTVLFTGDFDDEVSDEITIPAFTFGGATQIGMYVSANGHLTFGEESFSYNPLSDGFSAYTGAISPFGRDLQNTATGEVSWGQVGNEVVVEWKDVRRYNIAGEILSFQARLNTTTGQIKFVYGGTIASAAGFTNPQVGLRGVNNIFPSNVNNRTIGATGGSWINSTAGTANNSTMYFNSDNATTVPAAGLTYTWTIPPPCASTPTAGITASNATSVCVGANLALSLTGATAGTGIAYQWQSFNGTTFVDMAGLTANTATVSPINSTQYRCKVTCTPSTLFDYSTPVSISITSATYATIPYLEDFEAVWSNGCSVAPLGEAIPNNSWRNTPLSGNNSWRADNTTASVSEWTSIPNGLYTPTGGDGSLRSARFHSYDALFGTQGSLDLYVNLSNAGDKLLSFDYINTSGIDTLEVFISVDGGVVFTPVTTTLISTIASAWTNISATLSSTSATAIIRFRATSDYGGSDIGIDNVSVFFICSGMPNAGATTSNSPTSICAGATASLSLTGATLANGITYQWQSFDGTNFVDIVGETMRNLSTSPIADAQYRCKVTCTPSTLFAYSTPLSVTITAPTYVTTLPYLQDFETAWSSACSVNPFGGAIPSDFWRNLPYSGNNSWRADNTTTTLSGWGNLFGGYTPTGSQGSNRSARFHTNGINGNLQGSLDLYLNLSQAGDKLLQFDYINTGGSDILQVLLSTNGGSTFTPLTSTPATLGVAGTWTSVLVPIVSLSPTSVIRFRATSNFSFSDIGIDNVSIIPACSGTPMAGDVNFVNETVCSPTTLKLIGATIAPSLAYQWQSSTDNSMFTDLVGSTLSTYIAPVPNVPTWYRCVVTCTNGGANATSVAGKLTPFTNITTYPYNENFDAIITTNNAGTSPVPTNAINPTNSDLPCGWLVENSNADGNTWKNGNMGANASSPSNALAYNYTFSSDADDWVFSAPLQMTAGKVYIVSFKYRVQSSLYPEDLEVSWGTAQNAASMPAANQIANIVGAVNTSYVIQTCTAIVPTTTGIRYIGFHAKSIPGQWNIYVDDVQVIEVCPIAVLSTTLANSVLGAAYNQTVTQTGFVTPVAWTVSAGSLPTGLSLSGTTGAITGTPTATGTYTFTIKAEASGCSNEASYTLDTSCPTGGVFVPATTTALPTALPQSTIDVAYTTTITQSTFTGTVTWSATGLPAGLTIDTNTGIISGTATALTATPANIVVTATAPAPNASCSISANYTLTVACATIAVTPATLPDGTIDSMYPTQTLAQTGLTGGTIVWSIASGSLPTGLSLNTANGQITGTPTTFGTSTCTFGVTNGICSQTTSSYTINIAKIAQTITFGALSSKVYGDAPFTLGATATSNLAVTYSSSDLAVVTLMGNTATIVGAGTAVITASQAGNAVYLAATDVPQTFNVTKANQTLTFGTLINKTFGDASFDLSATASSILPATYTSSNTAVATISGNTVTIVGAGVTTITASQAGNGNYNAATDIPQTLTVLKANQTITFAGLAGKAFGDVPFNPSATASSGLSISYVSSNTAVATVSGNLVTIVGAGTSTLTASQAGNSNYNAASDASQLLTVGKANQTIIFAAITDKVVNDAPFNLNATSSAGLPITYAISTVPATIVATLSGNTITIVGVGSVTVTASQVGNTNYNGASNVSRTFAVNLPTSILPTLIASEVITYPNPNTSGLFQVSLGKLAKEQVSYQVFDAQGKNVQTGVWKDQEIQMLTLSGLANGTYTLHLLTNKGTVVQRLVIGK